MLYTSNVLNSAICQFYLNKTGGKYYWIKEERSDSTLLKQKAGGIECWDEPAEKLGGR